MARVEDDRDVDGSDAVERVAGSRGDETRDTRVLRPFQSTWAQSSPDHLIIIVRSIELTVEHTFNEPYSKNTINPTLRMRACVCTVMLINTLFQCTTMDHSGSTVCPVKCTQSKSFSSKFWSVQGVWSSVNFCHFHTSTLIVTHRGEHRMIWGCSVQNNDHGTRTVIQPERRLRLAKRMDGTLDLPIWEYLAQSLAWVEKKLLLRREK